MPRKSEAGATKWVDPDDAPELTAAFFDRAEIRIGDRLIRRGRPAAEAPKQLISLRLDQDVLSGLRALGPGWQTKVNDVLRLHLIQTATNTAGADPSADTHS
jgi:uncharacterized protein (DUF4415 family)